MAGLFNTTSCTLKASSYRSNSSTRFSRSLEAMQLQKDNEIQNIPIRSFSIELNENKSLLGPPSMSHQIGLKDFEMHSVLGKGAFGKVFLVSRKSTNNYFAMKVLRKASLEIHNGENINIERNLLEAIGHPFIVKLFYAFQTSYKLYLVLQMANGGELFNLLYKEKMFSESTAVFYTSELLLALTHLHSLGIIYRDLKPEVSLYNTRISYWHQMAIFY